MVFCQMKFLLDNINLAIHNEMSEITTIYAKLTFQPNLKRSGGTREKRFTEGFSTQPPGDYCFSSGLFSFWQYFDK
jgi:hypothetical protein